MRKILGATMIAAPFVSITALMWDIGGWQFPTVIWSFTIIVVALIAGGLALLNPNG